MRVVLLGAPGSGKGTQAQLMVKKYKIPQISTGDLLREAVAAESVLGKQAKVAMDLGKLVSDDLVLAIIQERLMQPDTQNGFILDGFPRNLPQVEALDTMLNQMGKPIHLGLLIEVDFDALMQRMTGRRTCLSCGKIWNIFTEPPKMDDQCDDCGGNLRHRSDDNEETISNRLRVYETQTKPVVEFYREKERLRSVQGIGEINDIFKAVSKICDETQKRVDEIDAELIQVTMEDLEKMVMEKSIKAQAGEAEEVDEPELAKEPVKKKTAPKKKVAAKKKAAPKKKAVVKKKAAPKKKAVAKKKAAPKKKTVAKKKAAPKKKAVAKKKAAPKKKAAAKKKVSPKKKMVAKKKTAPKKKAVAKKKAAPKKKSVAKKKAAPKKAKKKTTTKKKVTKKKRR